LKVFIGHNFIFDDFDGALWNGKRALDAKTRQF
jgi:hypothetical protein